MIVAGQQSREPIPISGLQAYMSEVIRQSENLEKAQTGSVLGLNLEVMDDVAADLADSMEELSALFEEQSLKEVAQRKLGRERTTPSAAFAKALSEWASQFADMPGRDFLTRILRQMRQPGSVPMTAKDLLKALARGSGDPSHQFAMLDILEKALGGKGEERLAQTVREAKQLLEGEKGAEVRAGINIAKEVNARAKTPEQMQDLRNLYRSETLGFKSPQDCFRSLLASRGPERLGESLDFLLKSCGIDLQNPSPSQSPEELRRIMLDLQCVDVLKAMLERCDGLVGKMPDVFGETSLLNGRQLAERLTGLTEAPFPSADDFASLLQSCGFMQLVAKIYFNTQLLELVRALSPRLFAEDGDRFKLIDAAQENLDGLVKTEEDEKKREGKERAA